MKIEEKSESIIKREKMIQQQFISYYHERNKMDNRRTTPLAELTAEYARRTRKIVEEN